MPEPIQSRVPFVPVVVVTGANGLVGARVCAVLSDRGAAVRALRRARKIG